MVARILHRFEQVATNCWFLRVLLLVPAFCGMCLAETQLPLLKVGDDFYTNVTVYSVTATDIYFSHSGGLGSAKLKSLQPALQQRFHFNPVKAAATEQQHATAYYSYAQNLKTTSTKVGGSDEVQPHQITAKSFLNQPSPPVIAEKWLSPMPTTAGKFVLVEFWSSSCEPCRNTIPELNALQQTFKDRLAVVGLSDESEVDARKMTETQIEFASAIDTQRRAMIAFEVERIPHAVLVDPKGIVRFEGHPRFLDEAKLAALLDRYSEQGTASASRRDE